jgi:hypothetical protein
MPIVSRQMNHPQQKTHNVQLVNNSEDNELASRNNMEKILNAYHSQ